MLKSNYRDSLDKFFYSESKAENTEDLKLVIENTELKNDLGINIDIKTLIKMDDKSIAQAYSGMQFGYFTVLGDGRAHLLGEIESEGKLYDIALKGSGRTPYSRSGDGKARLGPMLREYLISEFLNAVDIPTSRSLAVFETGQEILREESYRGAILVRTMESHIRVGTFQHAQYYGGQEKLDELLKYTINRLYPGLTLPEFLKEVIDRQARLVAKWTSIGFVHGVLNTDNVSISGEGFDYGPCAFIDDYDPKAVFSSIDRLGRYAFGNQPSISMWNLSKFAETLINPLADYGYGLEDIESQVRGFSEAYKGYFRDELGKKLGISDLSQGDDEFIMEMFRLLEKEKLDYHNFFIDLDKDRVNNKEFSAWLGQWEKRRNSQIITPQIIPRNHLVQIALDLAEGGRLNYFKDLLKMLQNPYDHVDPYFQQGMPEEMRKNFKTYCGT